MRDALLDFADGERQPLHFLARRLQDVERQPLRALGADAGEALQLGDELCQRFRKRHEP